MADELSKPGTAKILTSTDGIPFNELDVPDQYKTVEVEDELKGLTKLPAVRTKEMRKVGKALRKFGLVKFSQGDLRAFEDLGVSMDATTMLRMARGGAFLGQQAAAKILADLMRMAETANDRAKVKLVPHIGFMVSKLTLASKQMADDARRVGVTGNELAKGKPGREFVPNQIINIQQVSGSLTTDHTDKHGFVTTESTESTEKRIPDSRSLLPDA